MHYIVKADYDNGSTSSKTFDDEPMAETSWLMHTIAKGCTFANYSRSDTGEVIKTYDKAACEAMKPAVVKVQLSSAQKLTQAIKRLRMAQRGMPFRTIYDEPTAAIGREAMSDDLGLVLDALERLQ